MRLLLLLLVAIGGVVLGAEFSPSAVRHPRGCEQRRHQGTVSQSATTRDCEIGWSLNDFEGVFVFVFLQQMAGAESARPAGECLR